MPSQCGALNPDLDLARTTMSGAWAIIIHCTLPTIYRFPRLLALARIMKLTFFTLFFQHLLTIPLLQPLHQLSHPPQIFLFYWRQIFLLCPLPLPQSLRRNGSRISLTSFLRLRKPQSPKVFLNSPSLYVKPRGKLRLKSLKPLRGWLKQQ